MVSLAAGYELHILLTCHYGSTEKVLDFWSYFLPLRICTSVDAAVRRRALRCSTRLSEIEASRRLLGGREKSEKGQKSIGVSRRITAAEDSRQQSAALVS